MLFCHIVSRTSAVVAFVGASASLALMAGLNARTTFARTAAPALSEAFGVAQAEPKGMTLVQLAELPRLVEPQLSPDGRSVAYMLATADWTLNRLSYHLWRQDTSGGAPVPLTSGAPGEIPGS